MTTRDIGSQPVIIGGGLAGLMTALRLAPEPAVVLSKAPLETEASSAWAQGGIAACVGPDDSPALHLADTLAAGDGLCGPAAVRRIVQAGPAAIKALARLGAGFAQRFPGVAALCRAGGIDPATQPIPVRPAARYHMGGIAVDAAGRSTVDGLWACGEAACTGMHGANRLASNSLLEAAVCAGWVADDVAGASAGPVRLPSVGAAAPGRPWQGARGPVACGRRAAGGQGSGRGDCRPAPPRAVRRPGCRPCRCRAADRHGCAAAAAEPRSALGHGLPGPGRCRGLPEDPAP